MNPIKKRKVNHELREIQLKVWRMKEWDLLTFSQTTKITAALQTEKYLWRN